MLSLVGWGLWRMLPDPTFAPVVLDEAGDDTAPATAPAAPPVGEQPAPADVAPTPAPPGDARAAAEPRAVPKEGEAWGLEDPESRRERLRERRAEFLAAARRDLREDERRGGHTIARHVGLTDAQLRERLERESISAASTYPDLDTAERVVGLTLRRHAQRVERWEALEGPRPNLALPFAAPMQRPLGRVLRRDATEVEDAHYAVVVLRWQPDGSYVLTSYPELAPRGPRRGRPGAPPAGNFR
ncbi:MAG: RNase A-like domain-containing protein [Vicinamibacteria bacterium]